MQVLMTSSNSIGGIMTYLEFIESVKHERPDNKRFEHSECHHILPRCLGGSDEVDNLIYLTYREHFIAHQLLSREHPDNIDLAYAFNLMCRDKSGRELTPEEFEEAKNAVCGLHQNPERIEKRAQKLRGQTRTPEQRARISQSIKKAMNTPEMHEKLSKSAKSRKRSPHSEETVLKISESLKGRSKGPMSDSLKQKISNTLTGRIRSEEFRAKHRAENLSIETRRKLSESHRGPMIHRICQNCGRKFLTRIEDRFICTDCFYT